MSWATEHIHEIIEQFWQDGTARCPVDNGPLKLKLRKLHGGDYDLRAECLCCGRSKDIRRADDPRRQQFRSWTLFEVERLMRFALENDQVDCPVCGALLEKQPAQTSAWPLLIRCFRCGNSNQWHQVSLPVLLIPPSSAR